MKVRRFLPKPHQLVLGIGVAASLGTLASGVAPEITGWKDNSSIAREVFINVPAPLEVAFYLAVATGLFLTAWLTSLRVRNYERGKPDNRRTNKANVHRRKRPRDMATLESNVRSHLKLISRKPKRVRAYFGAKHIKYAA